MACFDKLHRHFPNSIDVMHQVRSHPSVSALPFMPGLLLLLLDISWALPLDALPIVMLFWLNLPPLPLRSSLRPARRWGGCDPR